MRTRPSAIPNNYPIYSVEIKVMYENYLSRCLSEDPPRYECDCLPFDLFRMSCLHNFEHSLIRHLTDEELETGQLKVVNPDEA